MLLNTKSAYTEERDFAFEYEWLYYEKRKKKLEKVHSTVYCMIHSFMDNKMANLLNNVKCVWIDDYIKFVTNVGKLGQM